MATASASTARPAAPEGSLPAVRLEVRTGGGRPTVYEVGDGGFLIGGVPGCDLRLPGGNVAPVVCLISRHARGASLRKLAPVQPIAVNGRNVSSTYLNNGDGITLGAVEVAVSFAPGTAPPPDGEPGSALRQRILEIEAREAEVQAAGEELEKERVHWYRRRDEIEAECRRHAEVAEATSQRLEQQESELAYARTELERREQAWRNGEEELDRQRQEWLPRIEGAETQFKEAKALRRQLAQIREQLYERYRNRRDRLNEKQKALRGAAKRLQEYKSQVDAEAVKNEAVRQEVELGRAENEGRAEQIQRERTALDDQLQVVGARQKELHDQLAARVQACDERERKLAEEQAALEKSQRQHQADLVRLDRIQAQHEQRKKQLEERAMEVDKRSEQLQRDLRDLEEQAVQMDEWHNRLAGETEKLAQMKQEHETAVAQVEQRAAALEGQQATLAALRTRMERMREELRRQEESLSDQRVMQEASESDLRERLAKSQKLGDELDSDFQLHKEERQRFEEERAVLGAAVAQFRQAQEALEVHEKDLNQRQEQQDVTAAEQAEQIGLLTARATQLEELHNRLSADRLTQREREAALSKAEQTLTSLQEQLRRRSEELHERQRQQSEQEAVLKEQVKTTEQERQQKATELENLRKELAERAAEVDVLARELARTQEIQRTEADHLKESGHSLSGQRQALAAERIAFQVERQAANDAAERTRREFEMARAEALELMRGLPDLETRAAIGMDRLLRAREQLHEHLAEVHGYARQSRDDLEAARQQVQADAERVRQQELAMQLARDEHRLAVAAFRQQLIEWQGRVAEMKQALLQGSTQLDRRQAEVQQQAQQIASTSARLAQQAEALQEKEQQVAERRAEMDRHLGDMREWYRRKLRELAGVDVAAQEAAATEMEAGGAPAAREAAADERTAEPGILSLTGEVEPGDRQLGDLLRALDLVDADTLTALLTEARRQRRSLRQLLLAGNYLTLYQMALIEAGNLDGLVLGPARVIDRLQAGPREAVYRVFDPRRNSEALLRWLAEAEMHDAVRPDEFRQRFGALVSLRDEHVAATYEVLEVVGRPAALQEWLTGLPGTDWPALTAAPGVWLRLLSQAALALRAAHDAGLGHGALTAASFVCTPEGVVKLCGLGEPRWLAVPPLPEDREADAAGDLRALGRIAAAWAAPAAPRKGAKAKPLPDALQAVLNRLSAEGDMAYESAAGLLGDLDRAGADSPANGTAWERFVREVREQAVDAAWRRSA